MAGSEKETNPKVKVPPGFEDFNLDPYHKLQKIKQKLKCKVPGWLWFLLITVPAFIFEALFVLLKSIGGGYYDEDDDADDDDMFKDSMKKQLESIMNDDRYLG